MLLGTESAKTAQTLSVPSSVFPAQRDALFLALGLSEGHFKGVVKLDERRPMGEQLPILMHSYSFYFNSGTS
ncbi:hypothetical protein WJX75_008071 [Coccomyxa subellipsoidea]|uniref:Uncharacterized protein n=1 Tax=Coccomyxa subellipsoidea TaxID=248742 RepID=A0ABR2YCG7_9CHLO